MIELDSILVVLMAEALAALLLLVLVFFLFSRRKSAGEQVAVNELITKFEDTETIKVKKLSQLISENCNVESDVLDALLKEMGDNERVLYQKIVQIFLNRDVELLKEIDENIDNLSEPYCKLLVHSSSSPLEAEKLDAVENKMNRLSKENEKLSEQLSVAMNTMDEVSAEYTRVYSGNQTELELENSSKKMFKTFSDTEQKIKQLYKDAVAEEL